MSRAGVGGKAAHQRWGVAGSLRTSPSCRRC